MPRINLDSKENNSSNAEVASISWAVLILILGSIGFSLFEIWSENSQLAEVHAAVLQLQPQVETARRNEVRLHTLADGVLALAPRDPIAARLVNDFKIHEANGGTSVSASINGAGGELKN
jgi:hypothetical protein